MKWPTYRLDQCTEIVSGSTPKTDIEKYWGGNINWATPKDLSSLNQKIISDTPDKITQEGYDSCSTQLLPVGSVLFSSRAPIGHVAINSVPMCTNQGFKSFIPKKELLDASYLYYWLIFKRDYLQSLGNGATFKEVSKATIARVEIPLPPLEEQRRITAILDKAEALRAKRREAIAKLDQLLQSMFLEMFGDPASNPKKWPIGKISEMLEVLSYGSSSKADIAGDVPILRMNNITYSGEMDLENLKYLSKESAKKYLISEGDILFNRTNSKELVGKTAVYYGPTPMAYAGYLIKGVVKKEHCAEYISAFMNSKYGKKLLQSMCKSIVGMANINAKEFGAIEIPFPPNDLQIKFKSKIKEINSKKSLMIKQEKEILNLSMALQQQYFQ